MIITSLSPKHSNASNQGAVIDSWKRYDKVISMNSETEILMLDGMYDIELIPTLKIMQHVYSKPLVNINAIFDFAFTHGSDLLLVNSDIILKDLPDFKRDGITILSRYDFTDDINRCKKFVNGFDVFFIPNKFLPIFPPSIYALGACWHDYYTPMTAINKGIPVYYYDYPMAFHKAHQVQYPVQEYFDIGEIFRWEFKLNKKLLIPMVAVKALQHINQNLIRL